MAGIIVQLAISWLLIWFFENGNPAMPGMMPTKRRLFEFGIFFIASSIFCSSDFSMRMYFADQRWVLNPDLKANLKIKRRSIVNQPNHKTTA
ncbi:MAG TPA: hypothetical protein VI548_02055 [Chitinophagaceae bacterium]|nr:hypothetical protein [Chitinophagaceae bacterium]